MLRAVASVVARTLPRVSTAISASVVSKIRARSAAVRPLIQVAHIHSHAGSHRPRDTIKEHHERLSLSEFQTKVGEMLRKWESPDKLCYYADHIQSICPEGAKDPHVLQIRSNIYYNTRQYQRVVNLVDEARRANIELRRDNVSVYIGALSALGQWREGLAEAEQNEEVFARPNVHKAILESRFKFDSKVGATQYFEHLRKTMPQVAFSDPVLTAVIKGTRDEPTFMTTASKLMTERMKDPRPISDSLGSAFLQSFSHNPQLVTLAEDWYRRITPVVPSRMLVTAMCSVYASLGLEERVNAMLRGYAKLSPPTEKMFEVVLRDYAAVGDMEAAERLCELMKQFTKRHGHTTLAQYKPKQHPPSKEVQYAKMLIAFDTLLAHAVKMGVPQTQQVFDEMAMRVTPQDLAQSGVWYLIEANVRAGNLADAEALFADTPSANGIAALMRGHLANDAPQRAIQLFQTLPLLKLSANAAVNTAYITALWKTGDGKANPAILAAKHLEHVITNHEPYDYHTVYALVDGAGYWHSTDAIWPLVEGAIKKGVVPFPSALEQMFQLDASDMSLAVGVTHTLLRLERIREAAATDPAMLHSKHFDVNFATSALRDALVPLIGTRVDVLQGKFNLRVSDAHLPDVLGTKWPGTRQKILANIRRQDPDVDMQKEALPNVLADRDREVQRIAEEREERAARLRTKGDSRQH